VEDVLGRPLSADERVHHINGVKTDNDPDNLYVCNNSRHMKAHFSVIKLLKTLIDGGILRFDRDLGVYRIAEHRRLRSLSPKDQPTVSPSGFATRHDEKAPIHGVGRPLASSLHAG
jgi:hypothetical protein